MEENSTNNVNDGTESSVNIDMVMEEYVNNYSSTVPMKPNYVSYSTTGERVVVDVKTANPNDIITITFRQ